MKVKQFLKAYAPARSSAIVEVNLYHKDTLKKERAELSTYELVHMDEINYAFFQDKLESFEIVKDVLGRTVLRLYCTMEG